MIMFLNRKSVINIVLFFGLLLAFAFSYLLGNFQFIILVSVLLFGSFLYGLYSKNPILSGVLGVLFVAVHLMFVYHRNELAEFYRIFDYFIILALIESLAGFFAGLSSFLFVFTGFEKKEYHLYLVVFLFFSALFFVFAGFFYFFSGIN